MNEAYLIIPLLAIISIINNLSMKLQLASGGKIMIYMFGIIGIPIHEFSHFLFCKIFGHKVTEAKFFSPNWETGVMGYIQHTYNRNNIFQSIGQVFISIAPMIVGTFLITILYNAFGISNIGLKSILDNPTLTIKCITFIYIFVCISSYMICSIQDFKNCFTGIVYTVVCIIVCMFLFPGVFAVAYNGLIFVLKLTIINLALSVLMFLLLGTNKK